MLTLKPSIYLGAVLTWITCTTGYPLVAQAQTNPAPAPTTAPALPEETLTPLVTQLSDQLATYITSSSCQDLSALVSKLQTSPTVATNDTSLIGQTLTTVKNSPQLKAIIVDKVGGPLVTKLIDCNMVPADLLLTPGTTTPPSSL